VESASTSSGGCTSRPGSERSKCGLPFNGHRANQNMGMWQGFGGRDPSLRLYQA